MQTSASLCQNDSSDCRVLDTQWLSVWHNEAPVLSRKWYTCVSSHTSSPWDDATNCMYSMIWHKWLNTATLPVSHILTVIWFKWPGIELMMWYTGKRSLLEIECQRCYSLVATYWALLHYCFSVCPFCISLSFICWNVHTVNMCQWHPLWVKIGKI